LLQVKQILEEIKASPYKELLITAPHTGVVEFEIDKPGEKVKAPAGGPWRKKKGTVLAYITREQNKKPIFAPQNGVVQEVHARWSGEFVQAGTELMKIRHYLTKEEVINLLLRRTLYLFRAPERAKYFFTPEIDVKVKARGPRSVKVREGMDLFIISRMKRETALSYNGPEGLIYAVYFQDNQVVDTGEPLIGVCPEDQAQQIEDVINRVHTNWEESE